MNCTTDSLQQQRLRRPRPPQLHDDDDVPQPPRLSDHNDDDDCVESVGYGENDDAGDDDGPKEKNCYYDEPQPDGKDHRFYSSGSSRWTRRTGRCICHRPHPPAVGPESPMQISQDPFVSSLLCMTPPGSV